jgi:hypothetical protein
LKEVVLSKSYFAFLLLSEATVLFGLIIEVPDGPPVRALVLAYLPLLLASDSDIKAS